MDHVASRYLPVLFALFMWALSFPAIKFALDEVDPLTLAAVRFILPLPIIYIYYLVESRWEKKMRGENGDSRQQDQKNDLTNPEILLPKMDNDPISSWIGFDIFRSPGFIMWIFALFNVVLPNIFQNYGMQSTPSGIASIIQGTGPIFTIVLASAFLKERLTGVQIIGILLALIGSLLLVSGGELSNDGSLAGKALILLSAISYSISGLIGKVILKNVTAGELTFRSFLMGGFMLGICALVIEQPIDLLELEGIYWGTLVSVALFPTCFAFLFWFRALKIIPLSRLVTSIFLIPVLAVIFSWIILGEEITYFTLATGIMVIGGVLVAQLAGQDHVID
jgi:drug/metabolite transporter (DMT)-like permease